MLARYYPCLAQHRTTLLLLAVPVIVVALTLLWPDESFATRATDRQSSLDSVVPSRFAEGIESDRAKAAAGTRPKSADNSQKTGPPLTGVVGLLPEDVRGTGTAALHLRLHDAESDRPISTRVRVWRLGAPAVGPWGAGDHIQFDGVVAAKGLRVVKWPVGRYRLSCSRQRRGAFDPPAFTVAAGNNDVVVLLRMPRSLDQRARLFDRHGAEVFTAKVGGIGGATASLEYHAPDWANVRAHRNRAWKLQVGASASDQGSSKRRQQTHAGNGFSLGAIPERTRLGGHYRSTYVYPAGRSRVVCRRNSKSARDGDLFVGPTISLAKLFAQVTTPAGVGVMKAGARVYAVAEAVRVKSEAPAAAALRLPIKLRVELRGHELLELVWNVGDPFPVRRLRAKRP